MGVGGAPWLERAERENEERPKVAVRLLDLKPGMIVADVGAGSGYYSELISKQVGPTGKVYATDIQPGMISSPPRAHRPQSKLTNVEPLLSTATDPALPAAAVDMILLVDVYHEFSEPQLCSASSSRPQTRRSRWSCSNSERRIPPSPSAPNTK